MDAIRIIIAENDEKQRKELARLLEGCPMLSIVGETGEGAEAVRMVIAKRPDLLICNMILPFYDAPAVLEQLHRQMEKLPKVVVISSVQQESYISKAFQSGADEYMIKPLNRQLLLRRMGELMESSELLAYADAPAQPAVEAEEQALSREERLRQAISALFLKIGLPAHLLGYRFALEAVLMLVEDPKLMKNRTKVLYPAVASLHDTSAFCVERAIRHVITLTWERGIAERFIKEQGQNSRLHLPVDRPTSGEFIALMAEYIRPRRRGSQQVTEGQH